MPIFEFECGNCEYVFEETVLAGEEMPNVCPMCEEKELRKLISMPALGKVRLYGQDWKHQINKEAKEAMNRAGKDENFLANLVGEDKYERKTKQYEKDQQNRPKIKKGNKK